MAGMSKELMTSVQSYLTKPWKKPEGLFTYDLLWPCQLYTLSVQCEGNNLNLFEKTCLRLIAKDQVNPYEQNTSNESDYLSTSSDFGYPSVASGFRDPNVASPFGFFSGYSSTYSNATNDFDSSNTLEQSSKRKNTVEQIASLLCLDKDLVSFIISRLLQKDLINDDLQLSCNGRKYCSDRNTEMTTAFLYVDAIGGEVLPFVSFDNPSFLLPTNKGKGWFLDNIGSNKVLFPDRILETKLYEPVHLSENKLKEVLQRFSLIQKTTTRTVPNNSDLRAYRGVSPKSAVKFQPNYQNVWLHCVCFLDDAQNIQVLNPFGYDDVLSELTNSITLSSDYEDLLNGLICAKTKGQIVNQKADHTDWLQTEGLYTSHLKLDQLTIQVETRYQKVQQYLRDNLAKQQNKSADAQANQQETAQVEAQLAMQGNAQATEQVSNQATNYAANQTANQVANQSANQVANQTAKQVANQAASNAHSSHFEILTLANYKYLASDIKLLLGSFEHLFNCLYVESFRALNVYGQSQESLDLLLENSSPNAIRDLLIKATQELDLVVNGKIIQFLSVTGDELKIVLAGTQSLRGWTAIAVFMAANLNTPSAIALRIAAAKIPRLLATLQRLQELKDQLDSEQKVTVTISELSKYCEQFKLIVSTWVSYKEQVSTNKENDSEPASKLSKAVKGTKPKFTPESLQQGLLKFFTPEDLQIYSDQVLENWKIAEALFQEQGIFDSKSKNASSSSNDSKASNASEISNVSKTSNASTGTYQDDCDPIFTLCVNSLATAYKSQLIDFLAQHGAFDMASSSKSTTSADQSNATDSKHAGFDEADHAQAGFDDKEFDDSNEFADSDAVNDKNGVDDDLDDGFDDGFDDFDDDFDEDFDDNLSESSLANEELSLKQRLSAKLAKAGFTLGENGLSGNFDFDDAKLNQVMQRRGKGTLAQLMMICVRGLELTDLEAVAKSRPKLFANLDELLTIVNNKPKTLSRQEALRLRAEIYTDCAHLLIWYALD